MSKDKMNPPTDMASELIAIYTRWGTELVKPLVVRDNLFYHQLTIQREPQKTYGISSTISQRLLLINISSKKKADEVLNELAGSGYSWHLSAANLLALPVEQKRKMSLFVTDLTYKYGAQKP